MNLSHLKTDSLYNEDQMSDQPTWFEPLVKRDIKMIKALIIEDNSRFQRCLQELLQAQNPDILVVTASDGTELMGMIESLGPSIVFMDIRLPGENGLELTKKIREARSDIPVVIMTSHPLDAYREAANAAGAAHFFQKDELSGAKIGEILNFLIR